MNVATCAIAAMAENRVIGKDGKLPWHLPEDLKHFKALTLGKPVIMGRKTFESLGKPLPGRDNLVLTRRDLRLYLKSGHTKRLAPVHPLMEALHLAKQLARQESQPEIMIIGGGEIYRHMLPHLDRIYLTIVAGAHEGDAFFPLLPEGEWRETARDDRDGFSFLTLDRHVTPAG